jgi:hypothetical protein
VVAHAHVADLVADGDDLSESLMADGVPGRHRQHPLGDSDVEVSARHHQRPNMRLPTVGDLRLGGIPPGVTPGLLECQLLHPAVLL